MTSRERVLLALRHREADRVPILDVPWPESETRWHREGMPAAVSAHDYFGYEIATFGANLSFQFPKVVIKEDDTHVVYTNDFGLTCQEFKDHESVPEQIDFRIRSREDWEEHKPRLAWNDARVDWPVLRRDYQEARRKDSYTRFIAGFGFDLVRRVIGAERLLLALVEEPSWIKDVYDTIAEQIIHACEEMMDRGCDFDGAYLWNDQAYKNGTFFSPAAYRALEFPAQKRMCDFFHARGMLVTLHTDGDVRRFIPFFVEAGFDCLQPLEVKAGMDLVELKKQYGDRLCLMGGIDTRAMADPDPSVIEREIRTKLSAAKVGGGYIYHSDHSVPDNVSFQQYERVIELVHRYGAY